MDMKMELMIKNGELLINKTLTIRKRIVNIGDFGQ